jgi:hypothetical protein
VTGAITSTGGLSLRLGGTEGVLTVRGNGASIELHRRASRSSPYYLDATTLTPPADESATIVALRELVRSMDAQGTPGIDPAEIVDGIRMLTACAWSHLHGGRLVGVGEVPDGLVVTGRSGGRYA